MTKRISGERHKKYFMCFDVGFKLGGGFTTAFHKRNISLASRAEGNPFD